MTDSGARRAQGPRRAAGAGAGEARYWPFSGDSLAEGPSYVQLRRLGELTLADVSGRPELRCPPAQRTSAKARPMVMVATVTAGKVAYRAHDGRLRAAGPRDVLVLESSGEADLRGEDGARFVALVLPAHLISPRFISSERLAGGVGRAHSSAVAALTHDLLVGLTLPERATPGSGALVDALGGLLSATLEGCWAQAKRADDPAAKMSKARLDQISAHMRRNFADPFLSADDVARALGISRRYLHKLFADQGRSFRQELVALRIDACLKAFADSEQDGKTIADIAFAAGYTDISQFNRHFRKLKGDTPSRSRRELALQGGWTGRAGAPVRRVGAEPAQPRRAALGKS